MQFEQATYYPSDTPGETDTSRVRLKPDAENRRFKFLKDGNEVKGVLVLMVGVARGIAESIEQKPHSLKSLVDIVDKENFRIKGKAYLGQLLAKRGYSLTPIPEDAIVTEYRASDEELREEARPPRKKTSPPRSGVLESEFIEV